MFFFALSLLEIIIKNNHENEFNLIVKEISKNNLCDYRINVYLSIGYLKFNYKYKAVETIYEFLDLVEFDPIPLKIAAKINLILGNDNEAMKNCKKLNKFESISLEDIAKDTSILELPHYYDY